MPARDNLSAINTILMKFHHDSVLQRLAKERLNEAEYQQFIRDFGTFQTLLRQEADYFRRDEAHPQYEPDHPLKVAEALVEFSKGGITDVRNYDQINRCIDYFHETVLDPTTSLYKISPVIVNTLILIGAGVLSTVFWPVVIPLLILQVSRRLYEISKTMNKVQAPEDYARVDTMETTLVQSQEVGHRIANVLRKINFSREQLEIHNIFKTLLQPQSRILVARPDLKDKLIEYRELLLNEAAFCKGNNNHPVLAARALFAVNNATNPIATEQALTRFERDAADPNFSPQTRQAASYIYTRLKLLVSAVFGFYRWTINNVKRYEAEHDYTHATRVIEASKEIVALMKSPSPSQFFSPLDSRTSDSRLPSSSSSTAESVTVHTDEGALSNLEYETALR